MLHDKMFKITKNLLAYKFKYDIFFRLINVSVDIFITQIL